MVGLLPALVIEDDEVSSPSCILRTASSAQRSVRAMLKGGRNPVCSMARFLPQFDKKGRPIRFTNVNAVGAATSVARRAS